MLLREKRQDLGDDGVQSFRYLRLKRRILVISIKNCQITNILSQYCILNTANFLLYITYLSFSSIGILLKIKKKLKKKIKKYTFTEYKRYKLFDPTLY